MAVRRNTMTAQEIATPMIGPGSTLVRLMVSANTTQTSHRYVPWLCGASINIWTQGGGLIEGQQTSQ
jgi:hypothetical protein